MSDLLGAFTFKATISDALSPVTGFHYVSNNAANLPTGVSSAYRACFETTRFPGLLTILLFDHSNLNIYYTYYEGSSTVTWKKIAFTS